MKVEGIQKGLTFVNENAQVSFPRLNDSVLDIDRSTADVSQSLQGSTLGGIIAEVVEKWHKAIQQQALVAGILMGVYGLVMLGGAIRVLYVLRTAPKHRGEGGGTSALPAQGLAWAKDRFRLYRSNPFDDSPGLTGPGPTPSTLPKQLR
jgi:hypothetical protein